MKKLVDGKLIDLTQEEIETRQAHDDLWENKRESREALNEILRLERLVTERRKREAILNSAGKAWLQEVENQIELQRQKL